MSCIRAILCHSHHMAESVNKDDCHFYARLEHNLCQGIFSQSDRGLLLGGTC